MTNHAALFCVSTHGCTLTNSANLIVAGGTVTLQAGQGFTLVRAAGTVYAMPAALRTATNAETVTGTSSTTVTTPAGVAAAIAAQTGRKLLTALTTTSGTSAVYTADLRQYSALEIEFADVSLTTNVAITLNGITATVALGATLTNMIRGKLTLDLASGRFVSATASVATGTGDGSVATGASLVGRAPLTNATASTTVTLAGGTFDLGSALIYGIEG
jgi:hypothetical protein